MSSKSKRTLRSPKLATVTTTLLLTGSPVLHGAEFLSSAERLNGAKTLEAITSTFSKVSESLVTIGYVSRGEGPIAVGIAVSEAAEHNIASVGATVAVDVLEEQQFGVLPDINASICQFNARGDVQAIGEDG